MITSRDERSWDERSPLLFMDAGCLSYVQEKKLAKDRIIINSTRFDNLEEYKIAQKYVVDLCDRIVIDLSKSLGEIHQVDYDLKSWNILLRYWLLEYVSYYYYRYRVMTDIMESYRVFFRKISTCHIDTFCYGNDFRKTVINSDLYNCYSGERISELLRIPIKEAVAGDEAALDIERKKNRQKESRQRVRVWNRITSDYIKFLETLSSENQLILYGNPLHFSVLYLTKAVICHGVCLKDSERKTITPGNFDTEKNYNTRSSIAFSHLQKKDRFESALAGWIRDDLPLSYLENFNKIKEKGINFFGDSKKIFVSIDGWMDDELCKSYLAYARSNGMKLIGIQHGGGGLFKEDIRSTDTLMTDVYYSWGWKGRRDETVKVLPSPRLSSQMKKKSYQEENNRRDVLFVANLESCYLRRFNYFPFMINIESYIRFQMELIKELHDKLTHFRCRLHPADYGWNMRQRIVDYVDAVYLDPEDCSFDDSLSQAKLLITDNMATVWADAYVRNLPFIIVMSPKFENFFQDAEDDIVALKKAEVFFESIKKAVDYVESVETNVTEWWNDPKRKEIIDAFACKYALYASDWEKVWFKEEKKWTIDGRKKSNE